MEDTSEEIRKKQIEIFLSLPEEVRFYRALQRMEDGKLLLESGVMSENPNISQADLRIEVFKKMYPDEFPPKEMEKIFQAFRDFYNK